MKRNALCGIIHVCAMLALLAGLAGCGSGGGGARSDIIAFQAKDGKGVGQIWATDGRGSPPRQLTTQGYNMEPSVSSNGRIVFSSSRDGDFEIYIMNADGSGQRRLTDDPGRDVYPAISWDGTKVAFASDRGGTENIYVMNADGTGVTALASGTDLRHSAFSRDGSTLAFVSDLDIYVVPSTGGSAVRILSNPGIDESPCYSPDGQKIAFARNTEGTLQVWVANANGSGMEQLTDETEGCGWPSWSPDGSKLVFVARRGGEFRLYTMNPDGTGIADLLPDTVIEEGQAWTSWGQ